MNSLELTAFDHLTIKFGQLLYGGTTQNSSAISRILDELNSLNYWYPIVKIPEKAVLFINQCCSTVHTDDETLAPKCAQLIQKLIITQKILVTGTTLHLAIQWCLRAVKSGKKSIELEALKTLEALLRNNVEKSFKFLDAIYKEIKEKIDAAMKAKNTVADELLLTSVKCLVTSTVLPPDLKNLNNFMPHLERSAEIFTWLLCSKLSLTKSTSQIKVLESCFLGLQKVILLHNDYLTKELRFILGIIKIYMVYGIKNIQFIEPERLVPTVLNIPEVVQDRSKGTNKKIRKPQRTLYRKRKDKLEKNPETFFETKELYTLNSMNFDCYSNNCLRNSELKTSDSEFSDSDGGNLAKVTRSCNKVRQEASNLFSLVIKNTERAIIFTFWTNFIPENISSSGKHNLISAIVDDPSTRGKLCSLNALLLLLSNNATYLGQAELRMKTSSFTPFSEILGLTLVEIHNKLSITLYHHSSMVLAQTLKCFAALIQATPYNRIQMNLITKIVRNVKPLVFHKDSTVQVTALIVFGCILVLDSRKQEVLQAMTKFHQETKTPKQPPTTDIDYVQFSSSEEELEEDENLQQDSMPWLLKRCIKNLGVNVDDSCNNRELPVPVKQESLQVISAMSRHYFEPLLSPFLSLVAKAISNGAKDIHEEVAFHAGRAIDFLADAINKIHQNSENVSVATAHLEFWNIMLTDPLIHLVQNEEYTSRRIIGCNSLGSMGSYLFEQLSRDKQLLCISLLFSCARDPDYVLRGAAARSLSLYANYNPLKEDEGFLVDTAQVILDMLQEDNLGLRSKASWALATFTSVLYTESIVSLELLTHDMVLKLLEASVKCATDHDRVKMNGTRAIGDLMQVLSEEFLADARCRKVTRQALDALVIASTSGTCMKTRWNACHALGKALKNSLIYVTLDVNSWQPLTFPKLCELVVAFPHFKVRIQAALALAAPVIRFHYGSYYIPIWEALLQALENSQHFDDLSEYKHRDNLVEQICLTLAHLTTLLTKEDLLSLENLINMHLETLKNHVQRTMELLVPEKSSNFVLAECALATFDSVVGIGAMEKGVVDLLKSIFTSQ
ncbi:hypothetical protein ABEB36_000884 [Hypothenemus hampei]|uniref:HEAT repeat-containing protein 6 n=1 Tax=Hypothenemus hampei TaxID=57062 RepID=A0ABD1FCU1_HYPHA